MGKYRLMYFNARGFAEISRYIFAEAGVEYEDVRFESEEWQKIKSKTPFGQAPVLEVDGQQIADSCVIARFLAREFGMAGKNRIEEGRVETYVAAAYDLVRPCIQIFGADDAKKKELTDKFISDTIPKFIGKFEEILDPSKNKLGFLVGDKVTYADFTLFHFLSFITNMVPEAFAKYPNVLAHKKKIENLPKIKAWIKKRPETKN